MIVATKTKETKDLEEKELEIGFLVDENILLKSERYHFGLEVIRLRKANAKLESEKQQKEQEKFMDKSDCEFTFETNEGIEIIVGYDKVVENREGAYPDNIKFLRMVEGFEENGDVYEAASDDLELKLEDKRNNMELTGQEHRGEE